MVFLSSCYATSVLYHASLRVPSTFFISSYDLLRIFLQCFVIFVVDAVTYDRLINGSVYSAMSFASKAKPSISYMNKYIASSR